MQILRTSLLGFLGVAVLAVGWLVGYRLMTRTDLTPRRVRTDRLDGNRLELGRATLRPNLPGNPAVELYFAVPLDPATGQVRATASTVLFCAPFLNEDRFLKRDGLRDEYLNFTRQNGWSLFALGIKGERTVSEDGRQNYYVYPESGWPEVVFAVKAWLEQVEKEKREIESLLNAHEEILKHDNCEISRWFSAAEILEEAKIIRHYAPYLEQEEKAANRAKQDENIKIPRWLDYARCTAVRFESREKLKKYRPETLAQAARIPGVNPADIAVLAVIIKRGHFPVINK